MAGQKYNEKLFATGAKFSVSNVWLLKDQILHEIPSVKAVSSFIYRKPVQYTGLQSHFAPQITRLLIGDAKISS